MTEIKEEIIKPIKEKKVRISNSVKKPRKQTKSERDYISKEEFHEVLVKFAKDKDEYETKNEGMILQIPETIGKYLQQIADGIFSSRKFHGSFHIKDELVSEGMYYALKGVRKYDPERSEKNPFGYFSRIIYHAGLQRVYKEVDFVNFKRALLTDEFTDICDSDGDCTVQRSEMVSWYNE